MVAGYSGGDIAVTKATSMVPIPDKPGLWRRLSSTFADFGIIGGLCYCVDFFLKRLPGCPRLLIYDFMAQPVPADGLLSDRLAKSFTIRPLGPRAPELEAMPPPRAVIDDRFIQGAECLGAFNRKNELVAYIWLINERYSEDEVRCDYVTNPPGESVFDFDVFVFPEYRMGLAFVGLWNGVGALLRQRGVRYSISRLDRYNVASRRSHDRLGWQRITTAAFLKLWGCELMIAPRCPPVSLSMRSTDRPALHLDASTLRD